MIPADLDFTGKTILITGAASGIGAACARWLAARGAARLVLVDRDAQALADLDPGTAVNRYAGDVADPGLWDRLSTEDVALDHAVLNAGISAGAAITEIVPADWRALMAVNLDGVMLSLQYCLRTMQPQRRGSIAVTASVSGIKAEPGTAAYGASKAAVIQLTKVAAKEAAPHGVRVNAIAPGGVDTPIWDDVPFFKDLVAQHGTRDAAMAALAAMATPLGRYATAEEIAGQIGFLLSDMAATITGSVLVSDGGYSL